MYDFDLLSTINEVVREKSIKKKILINALEEAMIIAVKKKFGVCIDLEAKFNEELNEMEVYEFKRIVERVKNKKCEIDLQSAIKMNPELNNNDIGEDLGIKLNSENLTRIATQSAKQIIIQKIKDAERFAIYDEYKNRKNELTTGRVKRFDKWGIVVDLGKTEAIIPIKEQLEKENIRIGDRIVAYILDVLEVAKGSQIILSRKTPQLVIKLFEQEVPEIIDGIISIESIARDPGFRSKIAVCSKDSDIDPVGACVGIRGIRVQSVVQELKGEKIDIIPFNEDMAKFACNALSPAEVSRVLVNEGNHTMHIIVPDDQLSLAIGKKGQNVKLASELIKWRINIDSESKTIKEKEKAWINLSKIKNLNDSQFCTLYNHGFRCIKDVMNAEVEFFDKIIGFEKKQFIEIKKKANLLQEKLDYEEKRKKKKMIEEVKILSIINKINFNNSKINSKILIDELKIITKNEVFLFKKRGINTIIDIYIEKDLSFLSSLTSINFDRIKIIYKESSDYIFQILKKNKLL
jgi:N utilization substance protein A